MSFIYSLISRNSDVVLCEYTEYAGNFQQISRMLLRKIKKNSKYSIEYDKYLFKNKYKYIFKYNRFTFHYTNENEITYICMTENINEKHAFSFLNDIRKKFIQNHDYGKIITLQAYSLNEFTDVLRQYMVILI